MPKRHCPQPQSDSKRVQFDALRRIALDHADRILNGANPGDLPVQWPTQYRMAINLGTAKALCASPCHRHLFARADEVIE